MALLSKKWRKRLKGAALGGLLAIPTGGLSIAAGAGLGGLATDLLGLGGDTDKGGAGTFAGARPNRPAWDSMLDPATGLMPEKYQIKGDVNTQGIEALRGEALRTGPSAWRTLSEQQEADKLAARQGGALAQAKSNLAQTGGLSSGAAERMMGRSTIEGLRARQGLAGQMALADEAKRMDTLSNLPGQELGLASFNRGTSEANVKLALDDIRQKREADLQSYLEQMKGWSAEKTAAATPSGGKK